CISRQLWWGHRIPAWYDGHGRIVVAHDEVEAYRKYENILREDPARVGEADAVKALLVAAQLYGSSTSALPAPARAQFERAHPHLLLRQDEDVLDTWFSSALWPFSTLDWPEDNPALRLYLP